MHHNVEFRTLISATQAKAFSLFLVPQALKLLTLPSEGSVLFTPNALGEEKCSIVDVHIGPFRSRWVSVVESYVPGSEFVDVGYEGPFAFWRHHHRVEPDPASQANAWLVDKIEFELPGSPIADLIGVPLVRARFRTMFEKRHRFHASWAGATVLKGPIENPPP